MEALVRVEGMTKEFPGVRALDGVHFDLRAGEIHALVGENGAGKSTLLKILGGSYHASDGTMTYNGTPFAPANPAEAQHLGISVIHQELNLVPDLTVSENIFLGREPRSALTRSVRWKEMESRTTELLARLGVHVHPRRIAASLSVSEQQMVEIAKALSFESRVIIMDEPTAALNDSETERLFDVARSLRDDGHGVVYVSHRLAEIFSLADRVTVFRDGRYVDTLQVAETDEDELVRLMVGRKVEQLFRREDVQRERRVLRVQDLHVGRSVKGASLEVRAGEVVGLGGLDGAGRYELAQALFGILPVTSGRMELLEEPFAPPNPRAAMRAGVGFLSADRKATGIFPDLSVTHNLSLSILDRLKRQALLDSTREQSVLQRFTSALGIRYSAPTQAIATLSGGNQQKVLLGRALAPEVRLLVLCEPTRGVDIGAKAEIHALVNQLTQDGLAVLMMSSDMLELLGMSDRVVVMHQGVVTGHLEGETLTEEAVVACATGHRIGVHNAEAVT